MLNVVLDTYKIVMMPSRNTFKHVIKNDTTLPLHQKLLPPPPLLLPLHQGELGSRGSGVIGALKMRM